MKKIMGYIIGFATMLGIFAMLYVVGAIYDTGKKITVTPYFFRTGLSATNQTNVPQTITEIGNRRLRDWLIQKFVQEYFYIIPDVDNVNARTGRRFYRMIRMMSTPNVANRWEQDVVPEIRELAGAGVRRTVRVFNEIFQPANSNYWHVDYELKTWYKPNDMSEVPQVTRGTMYIEIQQPDAIGRIYTPLSEVQAALQEGINPAAIFVFRVSDVLPGGK